MRVRKPGAYMYGNELSPDRKGTIGHRFGGRAFPPTHIRKKGCCGLRSQAFGDNIWKVPSHGSQAPPKSYDLDIRYKKGSEMYLADTLSRHFNGDEVHVVRSDFEEEIEVMTKIQDINQMVASEDKLARLKDETSKDEVLQAVKAAIQCGWPYFPFRNELVVQDGLVLRGDRVVISSTLRKETIQDLHAAHQGIESTLRRARGSIYWPNMNNEVKDYISRCDICLTYAPRQQKEPLLCHEVPDHPWAKSPQTFFSSRTKTTS